MERLTGVTEGVTLKPSPPRWEGRSCLFPGDRSSTEGGQAGQSPGAGLGLANPEAKGTVSLQHREPKSRKMTGSG